MQRLTLRQEAYGRIRERILSGELAAGMPLSEVELGRQLGMSRTPVREAIRQMEMEGLVDSAPGLGAVVRVPERGELEEMYDLRESLESYASIRAAERMGAGHLERLDQIGAEMEAIGRSVPRAAGRHLGGDALRRFIELDMAFHRVVFEAAANRFLTRILDGSRLLTRLFTSTFWRYDRAALDRACKFHAELVRALRRRDAEAARRSTVGAIRLSRRNALAAWDRELGKRPIRAITARRAAAARRRARSANP